ncbi:unnamed protein product [Polarella glacialis]|uniref:CS domain-containing protein n=1 Tax=Polarella glacialis TaxID=89957 RepID=A0A813L075_POLGL|nr:unnamed protein product [Polarella glacialis]
MAPSIYPAFAADDGFFYVAIPPSTDEEMRQVLFPTPITKNDDLSFVRALRADLGQEAPHTDTAARGGFFEELFGKQGDGPQALAGGEPEAVAAKEFRKEKDRVKDTLAKVESHQLELLLSMRNLEVITMQKACFETGVKGMALYHGGKSAENQPRNDRAIEILFAAGFPPKDLRGICFLTRTEEFMERDNLAPIWQRVDFVLGDCCTDAPWVKEVREEREKTGQKERDETEWLSSMQVDVPTLACGTNDKYAWRQTDEEVEIQFVPGPFRGIRATKRDIVVKIQPRSIFVRVRGRVLLKDLKLFAEVDPSSSYWTFDQETFELQVTLCKAEPEEAWGELGAEVVKAERPGTPAEAHSSSEPMPEPTIIADEPKGVPSALPAPALRRRWTSWPRAIAAACLIYYLAVLAAWMVSKGSAASSVPSDGVTSETWRRQLRLHGVKRGAAKPQVEI